MSFRRIQTLLIKTMAYQLLSRLHPSRCDCEHRTSKHTQGIRWDQYHTIRTFCLCDAHNPFGFYKLVQTKMIQSNLSR